MRDTGRAPLLAALLLSCGGGAPEAPAAGAPSTPGSPNGPNAPTAVVVDVDVRVDSGRAAISPYVYGSNQDDGATAFTVRRWGGNRITGYDWETNASNAGSDYLHNSDLYVVTNGGLPASAAATPASAVTHFHDQSLAIGARSIVSLQMAGFAAADAAGPVTVAQTAPSSRWVRVEPRKPTPLADVPDLGDGVVYMDEFVRFLVRKYGPASSPNGIRWYSLDNEPALWPATHPRIHPQKTGAAELVDRSIALAAAAKDVDPTLEILGPAAYGMAELLTMQDAADWPQVRAGADWYVAYYLTRMRQAEQAAGRRLLDALDVHWYPEARGDHRITDADATTAKDVAARLQAPRTLWDPTYREDSWIAQYFGGFLPLLPRLQRAIDDRYPGTKLAITEYDYGSGRTVDGGIAQADVLGIFGRDGVAIATRWGIGPSDRYASAAFALFRDYDGRRGTFGNTRVPARASDVARLSAYASITDGDATTAHLILLNKDVRDTVVARVRLGGGSYAGGEAWGFDASSARLTPRPAPRVAGGVLTYALPPLSATHVVLR